MSMAKRTPGLASLAGVAYKLDDKNGKYTWFDSLPEEFAAVGHATIQWSYLEFMLFRRSKGVARKAHTRLPTAASDNSLARRLTAFRQLVLKAEANAPKQREKYLQIAQRIARANGIRQRLIHHVWEYSPKDILRLLTFPRDLKGRVEPFDIEKIERFAEEVGALGFQLEYPRGWTTRRAFSSGGVVGRGFLLRLKGLGPPMVRAEAPHTLHPFSPKK